MRGNLRAENNAPASPSLNIFGTPPVKKYENLSMTIGNYQLLMHEPYLLLMSILILDAIMIMQLIKYHTYVILLIILMLLSNDLNFVYTSN